MYEDLVARLREDAEWAAGNEWETPLCIGDDLTAAADAIEDMDAQMDVLVKEDIEAQQELFGYRALGTLDHLISRKYLQDHAISAKHCDPAMQVVPLELVMRAPTADVAEVVHGRWLLDGRCSECLENPLTTHKSYCPNCGAKMDGGG